MTNFGRFQRLMQVLAGLATLVGATARAQTYQYWPSNRPEAGVTIRGDYVWVTNAGGSGEVYELKHMVGCAGFPPPGPGPEARVLYGPDNHLYGTYTGGNTGGFVFDIFPHATISPLPCWNVQDLHDFTGFPSDGAEPGHGDLTWDQQGNIYGTTILGGSLNVGVVYELMPPVPPSRTWTEKVIWNFTGHDGEYPQNAVIFDGNGNLLGTTKQGGAYGFGTVFKLTPSGNTWTETNIYDFQGGADGQYPIAGLMMDSSGNFYGATSDGGSGGGGTAFGLVPSGNTYTFNLLYSFSAPPGNSCGAWATLTMDNAGSLYGTGHCGGANGGGSVFKLTNTQNIWVYNSFHDFPAYRNDLLYPISNVSFDANGNLWGTASECVNVCYGGVWEITP